MGFALVFVDGALEVGLITDAEVLFEGDALDVDFGGSADQLLGGLLLLHPLLALLMAYLWKVIPHSVNNYLFIPSSSTLSIRFRKSKIITGTSGCPRDGSGSASTPSFSSPRCSRTAALRVLFRRCRF